MPSLRLAVVTRGLVIPSLRLTVMARWLVIPSLRLAVVTRGLVIPSLRLAVVTRRLVMPSWRLVTRCVRVAHGHSLRARLVLDSLRVVACLELAPTRRPRRAAAAIVGAGAWTPATVTPAVMAVALAAAWIPGVRSSAIFVIVMATVVAPPPVHTATAIAGCCSGCDFVVDDELATTMDVTTLRYQPQLQAFCSEITRDKQSELSACMQSGG